MCAASWGRTARSAMPPTGRNISGISRRTAVGRRAVSISIRSGPIRRSISSGSTTTCRCRDWRDGTIMRMRVGVDLQSRLPAGQYRGRRRLRLVLCLERCRRECADADADHRWGAWRALGLPLQGSARLVGERRITNGSRASGSRTRRPGCRGRSRSGSPSSAARRSTRQPISRTSSSTPSRRNRRLPNYSQRAA